MAKLDNQRHERFCQGVIEGKNHKEAVIAAGYSPKSAIHHASEFMARPHIRARIQELNDAATTSLTMSAIERKERLAEIARARITDFFNNGTPESGINPLALKSAAVKSIIITTVPDKDGGETVTIIKFKLHDPIKAIFELNRMEGIGSLNPQVNVAQTFIPIKEVVITLNGPKPPVP